MTVLTRREFVSRLGPILAWPLVAAHHRPNHTGGPKPPSSGVSVTIGAAPAGSNAAMPAGGYVEVVEW